MNYENLKELVQMVNEEMDSVADDYNERLNTVSVEMDNVNRRLERLYDAIETGSIQLADLAPRIQRLKQQQEQLNVSRLELENHLSDRKVELADAETVKKCVEGLKNTLDDDSITTRKSFIKAFVEEVRVTGSEVSLDYKPSFLKGMMPREFLSVPSIIQYGGRYRTIDRTFELAFSVSL